MTRHFLLAGIRAFGTFLIAAFGSSEVLMFSFLVTTRRDTMQKKVSKQLVEGGDQNGKMGFLSANHCRTTNKQQPTNLPVVDANRESHAFIAPFSRERHVDAVSGNSHRRRPNF